MKVCKNCGSQINENESYCTSCGKSYSENSKTANAGSSFMNFLKTPGGKIILTAALYVVFLLIIVALTATNTDIGIGIVGILCTYFGWKTLTAIQPAMFLWMSFAGWIIYFMVKFFLSVIIGTFVAPYKISAAIVNRIK